MARFGLASSLNPLARLTLKTLHSSLCEGSCRTHRDRDSLSSVRNGGEGWGEEALRHGEAVRKSGAPLSPTLSPFVPHGAREADVPLVTMITARTITTIHRSAHRWFETLAGALDFGADHTVGDVVVDESHGLHEGIDRGGADEFPAELLKVFRQS